MLTKAKSAGTECGEGDQRPGKEYFNRSASERGANKEKPTTETEKRSKRVVSATEATRGTSQGGNAEEKPGKRIQRVRYDELGVSYKGEKMA